MMPRLPLLLIGLSACQPGVLYTLETVPIDGATRSEEQALREELAAMMETMDVSSVVLRGIEVRDDLGHELLAGRYVPRSARIHLDRHWIAGMRESLRHEVCHAVDHQWGLPSDDGPGLFEAHVLWEEQLTDGYGVYTRHGKGRREGFASLCEMGPGGLDALRDSAHVEPWLREAADWMHHTVVVEEPEPPGLTPWLHEGDFELPQWERLYLDGMLGLQYERLTLVHANGGVLSTTAWGHDSDAVLPAYLLDVRDGSASFPGSTAMEAQASSGAGAMVAYPVGSGAPHVFVRAEPGAMWSHVGAVQAANVWLLNGEVVLARQERGRGYRVDRLQ